MKYNIGQLAYAYIFDTNQDPYVIKYLCLITEKQTNNYDRTLYTLLASNGRTVHKSGNALVSIEENDNESEEARRMREMMVYESYRGV